MMKREGGFGRPFCLRLLGHRATECRMPAFQHWFSGGALAAFIAFAATVATTGYAWYRSVVSEQDSAAQHSEDAAQKIRNNQAKDLLGKALAAANAISLEFNSLSEDQLERKTSDWASYTRDLIKAAYGDGEAELFLDNSGYTFMSAGNQSQKWNNIRVFTHGRTRRLTELLRRADALTVRSEFETSKFQVIP